MLNLNIRMQSIELESSLISSNDKIRVSLTALPENIKEAQIFEAKKINHVQPSFKIQFKDNTKEILIVFRKKNYLEGDPIIASTVIYTSNISNIFKERNNQDEKKVTLYQINHANGTANVVGHMYINFTVNEEIMRSKKNNNNNKINKENKKYNEFSKINSAFKKENEYLLLDDNFLN